MRRLLKYEAIGRDRRLHDDSPRRSTRRPRRQHLAFQLVVRRCGRPRVVGVPVGADGPAGFTLRAALQPAAVKDAQGRDTIGCGLLAAGTGSFQGRLRRVQPQVDAGDHRAGRSHAMVRQEHDRARVGRKCRHRDAQLLDDAFAADVLRMGFPRHDHLEREAAADRAQPRQVREQQARSLVTGHAPAKADGEAMRLQRPAARHLQQCPLGPGVCFESFAVGNGQHPDQKRRLMAPVGDVTVVKRAQRRRRPGQGMHAVGDRVDLIAGEQRTRGLRVAFGHAVHPPTQAERRSREVAAIRPGQRAKPSGRTKSAQPLLHQVIRVQVVPRFYRSVGREDALAANGLDQLCGLFGGSADGTVFAQQLQREEG